MCTSSNWDCKYKKDVTKPSCSNYCTGSCTGCLWFGDARLDCYDSVGWACTHDTIDVCGDSGCCEAACRDSTGCYYRPENSNCADLCQSDCTCCTHECGSCDECGGGSDCKDYGAWYGSCSYSHTCDETGTKERTVTTYKCSDTDSDDCDDCSSSSSTQTGVRPECDRDTDGWVCNDGKWCTINDDCSGGGCSGDPRDCSDADLCTQDSCNEGTDTCDHILRCDGSTCAIGSPSYCASCPHCGDDEKNCGEDCDNDHSECPDTPAPNLITIGTCEGDCSCSYQTFTCDAFTHTECQEVTLNDDGTKYYCTQDGGVWEWRISNNPDRCGGFFDGCNNELLNNFYCSAGACANNQIDCSQPGNSDGDGTACNCDCDGFDIEEALGITYSINPADGMTNPAGSDFSTENDLRDNDCDDCTDGNDKDVTDDLCPGECDYCVDENGGDYSTICDHDDIFCSGTEGHCFCDITDGICKDCSEYYSPLFCGYQQCMAFGAKNPNPYDTFPSFFCDPAESGEDRCDYDCIPCCEGCNCVNITLDIVRISTKTMIENTIEIEMTNDDPSKDIPIELYIKNEDDLKTCFGKRCEEWDYLFKNSTNFVFHPNNIWPAINYVESGIPPAGGAIAYFNFTPSGPTPIDLYPIDIGVRNPPGSPYANEPDGTCPPRAS
ncbi:MAG: hypothetical protein JSV92_03315 [archaeon]|nr:MAG: hypothetical protein JSV92_03315 [archaeon]